MKQKQAQTRSKSRHVDIIEGKTRKVHAIPIGVEWMFSEERRKEILSLLERNGRVSVTELVEHLGFSSDTIRRDLRSLEELGLLQRTHGGAIRLTASPTDGRIAPISPDEWDAKDQLCREAAKLIQPGETIFIEGSSTTLAMADHLPHGQQNTVLTNGWQIAARLRGREGVELIAVGGTMKAAGNTTGTLAIDQLKQFSVDRSFISASGVDPEKGVTTSTADTAFLKRTVAQISRQVILLADHRKLGRVAFTASLPIKKIDLLITDSQSDGQLVQQLRQAGVNVLVVA